MWCGLGFTVSLPSPPPPPPSLSLSHSLTQGNNDRSTFRIARETDYIGATLKYVCLSPLAYCVNRSLPSLFLFYPSSFSVSPFPSLSVPPLFSLPLPFPFLSLLPPSLPPYSATTTREHFVFSSNFLRGNM